MLDAGISYLYTRAHVREHGRGSARTAPAWFRDDSNSIGRIGHKLLVATPNHIMFMRLTTEGYSAITARRNYTDPSSATWTPR